MHPILKEGVSIGTFQYEGPDTTHYYIENADGEEFEISRRLWDALLKADGTRPLDLPDNGRRILPKLKRHGLVRTSRFVQDDGLFNRFILFPVGNRLQAGRLVFRAINAALPAVAILVFAMGIYVIASEGAGSGYDFSWWLYYGLIALSLALHELGHLLAMQSYQWSLTLLSVANINIILAGVNLLPASGLDGESALSAACGINSISEVAKRWLNNKKRR